MRKYLFILFLLTAAFSAKAQTDYTIIVKDLWFKVKENVENNSDGFLRIELIFDDESKYQVYYRDLDESQDREEGWAYPPFDLGRKPKGVKITGNVNFRSGTDAWYDDYYDLTVCDENGFEVDTHSPRMEHIFFNVTLIPHVSISSASTLLPDNDKITLNATPGFPSSVYNWEYSLDGSNYSAFPAATNSTGNPSPSVSLTDLVGAGALGMIKQNTWIRNKTCPTVFSNDRTLSNRVSSPHMTGYTVQPNKCFGESNGSVKIQFDRALYGNEFLNIFWEDASNPTGNYGEVKNLQALEPGNTYTLPAVLKAANYNIKLIGKYPDPSVSTYTEGPGHTINFGFAGPEEVKYSTKQRDVYCHGGSDATITINASGGVGNYSLGYRKIQESTDTWIPFSAAGSHTIAGLDTGSYSIRVRDGNGCMMKDASGNEVIRTVTINQPAEPLHVDNAQTINPLAFGYTDGSIRAVLTGGTPVGGDSYDLQWTRLDGTLLTPEAATTNPFTTQLKNIGDGQYVLLATDANYALTSGADAAGCMLKDTFTLTEPPPLVVTIEEKHFVSCKNSSDGKLYAKAQGGIEISIFRYKYQWFRKENGVWTDIQQTDSFAVNLKTGEYRIIITDKNNITKDTSFILVEPDLLTLAVSSTPLNCNGSNNGTASAVINGGTLPYGLEWTTGETTSTISNLAQGNYKAFVKDARGCQTEQQIKVSSPDPVEISNVLVKDPTCYKGADGAISYTATGGTLPYNYKWSHGASSALVNNLSSGDYKLTLTDAKGCPLEQTFRVNETPLVVIGLQKAVTLCVDQVYEADATIAKGSTYLWTGPNGYTAVEAKAKLSNEGTYYVTATNVNGCIGKDTVRITRSTAAVAAAMLATTQAFANETVTIVNISNPAPEKVEWLLPNNVSIVSKDDQQAQVKFTDAGLYIIGMRTMVGACEKTVKQPITIIQAQQFAEPGAANSPFVKEFRVGPNPSSGQFTVKIGLEEAGTIKLRLIDLNTGAVVHQQQQSGSKQYELPYNLTLTAGIYSLVLETAKEYRIIKVMIL